MKKIVLLLSVCGMLCCCKPQEWDEVVRVSYPLNEAYSELIVNNAFRVETFVPSESQPYGAIVEAGEKAQSLVRVEVRNGKLYIDLRSGNFGSTKRPIVYLPIEDIENLNVMELNGASLFAARTGTMSLKKIVLTGASVYSGDGVIYATNDNDELEGEVSLNLSGASEFSGIIYAPSVKMNLSGASVYKGTIHAPSVDAELSGASQCHLRKVSPDFSGDIEMNMRLSGASKMESGAFATTHVRGELSGASSAKVNCCDELSVNLTGASVLRYSVLSDACQLDFDCHWSEGSRVIAE